jgi:hypothetical protein
MMLPGLTGKVARRLLPAAVVVPFALGWLELMGQHLGWYGTEVGVAILAASIVLVLVLFIWWSLNSISNLEAAEERVHAELRKKNEALQQQAQLINFSNDAIIMMDTRRIKVIHQFLQTVSPISVEAIGAISSRFS